MAYTQNNTFNNYYKRTSDLLISDDSRLVTMSIYLNLKDIIDLQLSDKIYIDGVMYVINKIRDFNASNPSVTRVELIKMEDTISNPTYTLGQPEIQSIEFN